MANRDIINKEELISYIENISKTPISKVLASDSILDYIILMHDEDAGIGYNLKYDSINKNFIFFNMNPMIQGEFLTPLEMIDIIKDFKVGEKGIIKVIYCTTKLYK